jgi:hypothetical protein
MIAQAFGLGIGVGRFSSPLRGVGVRGGFVIIVWTSGLGMGVGRFSRLLRGVGVRAMLDVGLDTTRCVEFVCEVPLGASVLRLLVPSVAVGVIIDRRCVGDWVISATRELVSEDKGVEF